MDRVIPPSPTPSLRERSPVVFYPLNQHRSIASQARCSTPFDTVHAVARSASKYHMPEPQNFGHRDSPSMAYTQPHQGLPFQYPALHPGEDTGAYETSHTASTPQLYNLNTPEASPQTAPQQLSTSPRVARMSVPPRATQGMKVLAVKTGRVAKNTTSKRRATSLSASPTMINKDKPPKSGDNNNFTKIDKPLSDYAKLWNMPIADIGAYVNRSAEQRHEEVEKGKEPGKVKRAMNTFMLYRKAYQDHAKRWSQTGNHQAVSKICGESWKIEREDVIQQFNDWAHIERDNHHDAHPEYKFTPAKPRKKGKDELGDEPGGDAAEWNNTGHRDLAYHQTSRPPLVDPRAAPYGFPYSTVAVPDPQVYPGFHPRHPQHVPNPSRHTPTPYDTEEYASGGMHYRHGPAGHHHHLDNMMYANPSQPGVSIGLGSANHPVSHQGFDLGGQYPSQPQNIGTTSHHQVHGHPAGGIGQQIDPSLMPRDSIQHYDMANSVLATGRLGESQWQPSLHAGADASNMYPGPYLAEVEESLIPEANLQYLQGGSESWKVDDVNEADDWQGLGGT